VLAVLSVETRVSSWRSSYRNRVSSWTGWPVERLSCSRWTGWPVERPSCSRWTGWPVERLSCTVEQGDLLWAQLQQLEQLGGQAIGIGWAVGGPAVAVEQLEAKLQPSCSRWTGWAVEWSSCSSWKPSYRNRVSSWRPIWGNTVKTSSRGSQTSFIV